MERTYKLNLRQVDINITPKSNALLSANNYEYTDDSVKTMHYTSTSGIMQHTMKDLLVYILDILNKENIVTTNEQQYEIYRVLLDYYVIMVGTLSVITSNIDKTDIGDLDITEYEDDVMESLLDGFIILEQHLKIDINGIVNDNIDTDLNIFTNESTLFTPQYIRNNFDHMLEHVKSNNISNLLNIVPTNITFSEKHIMASFVYIHKEN